ncbi:flagellar biosynthetic protein FliO [Altererythrobacter sp. KTW20L]|uniref:flagellar biosynthetic protein FliO n=1 Tax=Altererythrobacter sp. KTW20L TaxID=2942210 RepID=UPI0020BDABFC|nr:flagellar biosynthetic protein FliO [Altererythrobacter sp. KTW20L]MCL6252183.1 flagellar biosynthetic protein FliO [Altererythrobacter sp. KTW20L]
MVWYVLKLLLLLPLLAGLIWGSLWLTRKAQSHMTRAEGNKVKAARLVETTFLAPGIRLAVIEFRGREILVGASKQGLVRLAEADLPVTRAVELQP